LFRLTLFFTSVYRAYNHDGPGRVAACKIVSLPDPTRSQGKNKAEVDLKALQKEVQVHRSLKHKNILEFMDSLLVKPEHEQYVPGLYMLIELAMHGDLFDKIGEC
jgi:serine/threonine-protein kinase Chk1